MTKTAALYDFFSGFGIMAYADTAVPDDVTFPYMTYSVATSAFKEGEVNCTVNLWYYTTSEAAANLKADEIGRRIGPGGVLIPCDDGVIWVKKGSPWCQNLTDDTDHMVKRRYINITLEYLTT